MNLIKHIAVISALVLTAGCGGGGSDGATPSAGSGNEWLQLTPASVEISSFQGRTQQFSIVAKSSRTIAQAFNIGIIEPKGLIRTNVSVSALSQLEYRATLEVSGTLAVGSHTGRLEIRLCEDNPVTCARPIAGSPWFVPIVVTVRPAA